MIKWKRNTARYANEYNGLVGKYQFFNLYWDAGSPPVNEEGEKLYHCLKCKLPGIKTYLGHFFTENEGKEHAEKVLKTWLKNTGLKGVDK